MKRQIANEACSGTIAPSDQRARVVVAASPGGPLALMLHGSRGTSQTVIVGSRSEALQELAHADAWVLVTEPVIGLDSGLDLARAATHRDGDLAALVLYDDATLPAVLRAVREGTTIRFLDAGLAKDSAAQIACSLLETRAQEERRRADRRTSPRVSPPDVAIVHPQGAELVDITPDGIALRCNHPLHTDGSLRIALRVGGKRRIECSAEIVRQDRDPLDRHEVAARFVDLSSHAKRALQTVVRRQLSAQGPREMQQRFREASSADVFPIANPRRIASLLARAREERVLMALQTASGGVSWRGTVRGVDENAQRFQLDVPPTVTAVAPGQSLDCLLQQEFESYLFEARLLRTGLDHLECQFPRLVYYSEKRSRARLRTATQTLGISFPHPKSDGSWLDFEALDVSASGASFAADLDRLVIFPGTTIDPLRLTLGDHVVLTERAEVRHVTPLGDGRSHKIGLRFVPPPLKIRSAAHTTAPQGGSSPVSLAVSPGHQARVVRFNNDDGEEIVALLNVSTRRENSRGPMVVIPPSWGACKETFSAYSLALIEAFERLSQPAAVLRFDYTDHKGESHISPEHRVPGREAMNFRLSSAVDDALAAVDFCFSNPIFEPTSLVLFGPSISAPIALRVAALDRRVGHVVAIMGAPSSQEVVKNASGGLDYIGSHRLGARFGIVDFLGMAVDMDGIAADAIRSRLAFVADAQDDLAKLEVPVDWFAAQHDGWINPRQVERLLECGRPGLCQLTVLECGHLPTRDEGLVAAAAVTRRVLHRLGLEEHATSVPHPAVLDAVQAAEWSRAPKARVESSGGYWREYLLGTRSESLGFDVFAGSAAYQDFAGKQIELLDLAASERLLDAGGGTGQLVHHLLTHWNGALPRSVEIVDLVPDALERARGRIATAPRAAEVTLSFRPATLEVSPLRPFQRFLAGELPSIASLRGRIKGLTDELVERLSHEYELPTAASLHAAIRGAVVEAESLGFLDEELRAVVADLGRAARFLRGQLTVNDLRARPGIEPEYLGNRFGADARRASQIAFEVLDLADAEIPQPLELATAAYDRIVCSLVLPYLRNPDETVLELARALRPGGILVASTMKPDLDLSKLQAGLVDEIVAGGTDGARDLDRNRLLDEVRTYSGAAAFLLRLTQEGTFRFLSSADLTALLSGAGLVEVTLRPAFGTPPQAYIARGRKP